MGATPSGAFVRKKNIAAMAPEVQRWPAMASTIVCARFRRGGPTHINKFAYEVGFELFYQSDSGDTWAGF